MSVKDLDQSVFSAIVRRIVQKYFWWFVGELEIVQIAIGYMDNMSSQERLLISNVKDYFEIYLSDRIATTYV